MVVVLVPIALLLTAYVAYAASRQSHAWADAFVNWLRNFPVVGTAVAAVLGKLLVNGADWISNRLGHVYLGLQARAVNWIGGIGHYVVMASKATIEWPIDLVTFARWLVSAEIPRLIHGLPNSLTRLVHAARAALTALEQDVAKLYAHLPGRIRAGVGAGLAAALAPFILPLRWLASVYRPIAHAAATAGGIAAPWIELPRLRRDARNLERKLGKVWPLLGVAGAVALLARALKIPRRCVQGNIGKVAKRLCGLDTSLLDSLLLDLVAILSVVSVVEFAEDMRTIEDEALAVMGRLVREWPS